MSWASEEWKNSLSSIALQKVECLEKSLAQIQKDRDQKKFQNDTLTQSLENQKKKTEEQKSQVSLMKRDISSLEEQCRDLDINREKVC